MVGTKGHFLFGFGRNAKKMWKLVVLFPNGDKIRPKNTREHLLSIYGYITGLKKDVKHMHDGIHDLGGKIDKIYWVLLGTVGAVSLLLLEKVLDKGWF